MALALDQLTQQVQALYIAYFGRAAEPDGFTYWVDAISSGRMTFLQVAASFSVQPEATKQHPFLADAGAVSPGAFIDSLYLKLFNREPDANGKSYWMAQLQEANGDPVAVGFIVAQFILGADANNGDAAIVQNKVEAGQYFTAQLQAAGIGGTVGGVLDPSLEELARNAVDNDITSDPDSIETTKEAVDGHLNPPPDPGANPPPVDNPGPPANQAPTGAPNATLAAATEDEPYTVTAASLLLGFSDADGDTLSIVNLSALNGTVINNGNGTYTIKPTDDYYGPMTLTYGVADGKGGALSGQTLSYTVTPIEQKVAGARYERENAPVDAAGRDGDEFLLLGTGISGDVARVAGHTTHGVEGAFVIHPHKIPEYARSLDPTVDHFGGDVAVYKVNKGAELYGTRADWNLDVIEITGIGPSTTTLNDVQFKLYLDTDSTDAIDWGVVLTLVKVPGNEASGWGWQSNKDYDTTEGLDLFTDNAGVSNQVDAQSMNIAWDFWNKGIKPVGENAWDFKNDTGTFDVKLVGMIGTETVVYNHIRIDIIAAG